MTPHTWYRWTWVLGSLAVTVIACDSGRSPTSPSGPSSFLAGTWQGTVTIQINPGDAGTPPPSSGPMMWTFEVTPNTNQQSFRTTIRSDHPWLSITTTATTALSPGNTPPTQISTQGQFASPRGCTVLGSTSAHKELAACLQSIRMRRLRF